MQKLHRNKPYKMVPPMQTINGIRNILAELNLFTVEQHLTNEGEFHSCQLTLDNKGLGKFGISTNGKGMNREYSMASAHAEFIERLQNNAKILLQHEHSTRRFLENNEVHESYLGKLLKQNLISDFQFAPDEKFLPVDKAVSLNPQIYSQLFSLSDKAEITAFISSKLQTDEVECLPFYDVKKGNTTLLPLRYIQIACGTNGMCAGNNAEEAILQGISELFERYAIREIYMNELTLPTIPLEYFEGHEIYQRIKELQQKNNYTLLIKDCSVNKGIPVIGALIIDHTNNTYTLHLGADPSPVTALERCFTEVYQGGKSARFAELHYNSEDVFYHLSKTNKRSRQWNKLNQMYKTIKDGTGIWPGNIFMPHNQTFNGFEHTTSESNSKDLQYYLNILHKNGWDLYIRNQSFLGFPSYYIYIPQISHLYNIEDNSSYEIAYNIKHHYFTLNNLNNVCEKNLEHLVKTLEQDYLHPSSNEKNIRQYYPALDNSHFVDMNTELFMVMLFYRVGNLKKAYQYLVKHLEINKKSHVDYTYLYAVAEYLKLRLKNLDEPIIHTNLEIQYGKKIANSVIHDMTDPNKIFQYHKLPNCFNCSQCPVEQNCRIFDMLKIYKPLKEQHKQGLANQQDTQILFDKLLLHKVQLLV